MPAFSRLKYSCVTSLTVGSDSFIVNCCAIAGAAAESMLAAAPATTKRLTVVRIGTSSQSLFYGFASSVRTPISEISGM